MNIDRQGPIKISDVRLSTILLFKILTNRYQGFMRLSMPLETMGDMRKRKRQQEFDQSPTQGNENKLVHTMGAKHL